VRILIVTLAISLLAATVTSGDDGAASNQLVRHEVTRATSEINIDGVLDEPAWSDALRVNLDYEVQPGENISPPVSTECLVTYDDRRVYFGFIASDPDPSKIRARYSDRDRAWNDDWVGIVLDTFNDERRAYELLSNPLGVQIDAINDDVRGNYDDSWNAIWDSAGQITESGYQVEIAVPFSQIRFQSVDGTQVWGFDAIRSYPRNDRHHIGLFPRERGNNSYLGQTVKLVGMAGVSAGSNLELIPTLTATRNESRDQDPDSDFEESDSGGELGLSVRWGITPNMSLNGAVNPDFSQVEADAVQLDVNEQFALFFPESRPFFLEGADYFNTNLGLVHTRTVGDPSLAAKVTGKEGRHTLGLFTAQDDVTNLIFPGSEGSSSGSFDFQTLNTVGRYRYDLGRASTIGATVTDRRGDDYYNTVVSVDTVYRISEDDEIAFSAADSSTQYNQEMVEEFEVRDDAFGDTAILFNYQHSVRNWWTNVRYSDFGEGYRSDLGFRPRVDFRTWIVGGAKVWWGESGNFFNRIGLGADVDRTENQAGQLLDEELESWLNLNGPRQSFVHLGLGTRNQVYEGVEFDQNFYNLYFNMRPSADWWFGMDVNVGDWIDFDHVRPADRLILRPRVRYNFGRHLEVQYNHTYQRLDVEGGRLFEIHVPELRVVHQFNTRSFVRAIVQYSSIERDPTLYDEVVDAKSDDLLGQLLFTYKVNPETALYFGYTEVLLGTDELDLTRTDRTLFLKLSYAWLL